MDNSSSIETSCDVEMADLEKKPDVDEIKEEQSIKAVPESQLKVKELEENSDAFLPHGNKCPICLNAFTDLTVLDACPHHFCFECICEWLKMKPECPLCKRNLRYLKHKLVLKEDETPTWEKDGKEESISEFRNNFELDQIRRTAEYTPVYERRQVEGIIRILKSKKIEVRQYYAHGILRDSEYRDRVRDIQRELDRHQNLLNMLSEDPPLRAKVFNDLTFRRLIYHKDLAPRVIVAPRFPVFLNEAYVRTQEESARERLIPFIVRDLAALTERDALDADPCIEMIFRYLKGEILRGEVITFLRSKGVPHPHQFLNNLSHFAETGQSLHVYDENTEYVPRIMNHIVGGDDHDVEVLENADDQVQVIAETRRRPHQRNDQDHNYNQRREQLRQDMQNRLRHLRRRMTPFIPSQPQEPVIVDSSDSNSSDDELQVIEERNARSSPGTTSNLGLRPVNSAPDIETMQQSQQKATATNRPSSFLNYDSPFGSNFGSRANYSGGNIFGFPSIIQDMVSRFRPQHARRHEAETSQHPSSEPVSAISDEDEDEIYSYPACRLPRSSVNRATRDGESSRRSNRNFIGPIGPSWLTNVLGASQDRGDEPQDSRGGTGRQPSIVELDENSDDDEYAIEVIEDTGKEIVKRTPKAKSAKEKRQKEKRSRPEQVEMDE